MTPEEITAIEHAFSRSLEPVMVELRGIHGVLDQHSRLLDQHSKQLEEHTRILTEHTKILVQHSQLLANIDMRLVRVEGNLDGVEILVRSKTG